VDAGFLIGLYDESDQYHEKAMAYFLDFFDSTQNRLLVAWPILYETVSTRMARKNTKGIKQLEQDWKRLSAESRLHLLSDAEFRDEAIDECFKELGKPPQQYRDLSLVDRVLRKILSEQNLRIHAFVTFNPRDFHDVCGKFGRELLY
jgi:predicted nucleic acid-binding protein